jgi:hypothetical protein
MPIDIKDEEEEYLMKAKNKFSIVIDETKDNKWFSQTAGLILVVWGLWVLVAVII